MTIYTEVELACDGHPTDPHGCDDTRPVHGPNGQWVRREAKEEGWQVGLKGGRDLCPDHRGDRRPS